MSRTIEVVSNDVVYTVIIDKDLILPSKVSKRNNYYTVKVNKKNVYLHRYVLGVTDSNIQVDHINGDYTDNRACNLRIADNSKNNANRKNKGIKQISKNRWQARVTKEGVTHNAGSYGAPEEAIQAYRKKHVELFGEFSPWRETS